MKAPLLTALGVILLVGGVLLMLGVVDRRDRQASLQGGVVARTSPHTKWAPGWGLICVAGGGALIVLGRRRKPPA